MAPKYLVPVSLLVGVSSVVGLYYVEKQTKANMVLASLEPDNDTIADKMKKAKQIRMGLMAATLLSCLALIYGLIAEKKATSSFESRVSNAASNLRSSMEMGQPSSSSSIFPSPNSSADTSDEFASRVSNAAARLREQISKHGSSAEVFTPAPSAVPDLAAEASAEISQFIADNS